LRVLAGISHSCQRQGFSGATSLQLEVSICSGKVISKTWKVLKAARLVVDRAEGTRRLYAVEAQGLEALRGWIDGFWDGALAAFKEAAERETKKHKRKS
jgi:hypothetical protein